MTRQERVDIANRMIEIIAAHGRRFFHYEGRVSRFELDGRGRVWFVDSWEGARTFTHYRGRWRRFHNGGTLKALVEHLRDFIMGRRGLPLEHLGPWPDWYCGGDLWGYGDAMTTVRQEASQLQREVAA